MLPSIVLAATLCLASAKYYPKKPRSLQLFAHCSPGKTPCAKGLRCVGISANNHFCLTPMVLGGPCGGHAHYFCASQHKCVNQRCVVLVPLGGGCGGTRVCGNNLQCLRNRCTRVSPLGGPCGMSSTECGKGLRCRMKKCRRVMPGYRFGGARIIGPGRYCDQRTRICAKGLTCVGRWRSVCRRVTIVLVVGLGRRCDGKTRKCSSGLLCRRNRCRRRASGVRQVGVGRYCDQRTRVCANGLVCTGSWRSVCRRVSMTTFVGLGGFCNRVNLTCSTGLMCRASRCRRRTVYGGRHIRFVGLNRFCDQRRRVCATGLICIGKWKSVCRRPVQRRTVYGGLKVKVVGIGYYCNGRTLVCSRGSACVGRWKSVCRRVKPVSGAYFNFLAAKRRAFVRRVRAGSVCGGSRLRCVRGLSCVKVGSTRTCQKVVGVGHRCSLLGGMCRKGARCRRGRCVIFRRPGLRCNNRFWLCRKGSRCIRGRCSKRVGVTVVSPGKPCNGSSVKCKKGFSCRGDRRKRCVKVLSSNGNCGPSWALCRGGLKCIRNRCTRVAAVAAVVVQFLGSCNKKSETCATGFSCFGATGKKVCSQLQSAGGFCGIPGWACGAGLKCNGHGHGSLCVKS